MFQIQTVTYASDALEDAMRLAQTKSLNSFTFSDCLNYLNYAWSDIYSRIAMIDAGFYSKVMRIKDKVTHLPPFVKNAVTVYRSQQANSRPRHVYSSSGQNDMNSQGTYYLTGNDLYVPDADRCTIWMEYVPACPFISFTHHNRDPKILEQWEEKEPNVDFKYHRFVLEKNGDSIANVTRIDKRDNSEEDVSNLFLKEDDWELRRLICDFPYIFVSYYNTVLDEWYSGFYDKDMSFTYYNPFAFTGRGSNVEYLDAKWNDKTGMGVVIKDHSDNKIKELGWTPDTIVNYPCPEVYRYLVARLADKLSAINESNVMGVAKELVEAEYAFEAFLKKDKASFQRITNVTGPSMGDWL